ncbi:MAG TPA: hypothetical protein VGA11_01940 [Acidimicrobiia bacterium]
MITVQYVVATALSLLVLVTMANFVVDLYARGVVRSAVDEGARAGAPLDASDDTCAERSQQVVANLLGGAMGRSVHVSCRTARGTVTAHADVQLTGWIPVLVPDWRFALDGTASKEQTP